MNTYSNSKNKLNLTLNLKRFDLPLDTVLNIGLIVNEVLSNSIKYAFLKTTNGDIWIDCYQNNDICELIIGDNGIGIKDDNIAKKDSSYGLQLITMFTKQIKGDLKIANNKGTVFHITFPKPTLSEQK